MNAAFLQKLRTEQNNLAITIATLERLTLTQRRNGAARKAERALAANGGMVAPEGMPTLKGMSLKEAIPIALQAVKPQRLAGKELAELLRAGGMDVQGKSAAVVASLLARTRAGVKKSGKTYRAA